MTEKQIVSIAYDSVYYNYSVIPHLKKTRRYHDYIDSIIYYLDL